MLEKLEMLLNYRGDKEGRREEGGRKNQVFMFSLSFSSQLTYIHMCICPCISVIIVCLPIACKLAKL